MSTADWTRVGAAVVAVVVLVSACSGDGETAAPTTTVAVDAPGLAVDDLVPGDCLLDIPAEPTDRVETVECVNEHRAEVYASHELDDEGDFPGVAVVNEDAAIGCAGLFAAHAGEPIDPTTDRAFTELVPSAPSWGDGDRRVVCLALPPGGALESGSIAAVDSSDPSAP